MKRPSTHDHAALGFRVWVVADERLHSPIINNRWYQGQNASQCLRPRLIGGHAKPTRRCQCGFHAYHSLEDALRHGHYLSNHLGLNCVIGAIAASGAIQIHYDGFRAQWAEPLALWSGSTIHPVELFNLSSHYQLALLNQDQLACGGSYEGVRIIDAELRPRPRKWQSGDRYDLC